MKSLPMERIFYLRGALLLVLGICAIVCLSCSDDDYFMAPPQPYSEIDRFPVWSPDGEKVIYFHFGITEIREGGSTRSDYNQFGIWMIDINGDNPHLIIHGATYADYSDDGEWLAYELGRNIYKVRIIGNCIDSTTVQQLTFEGDNYFPSWSPDGTWIVYDSDVQETPSEFAIWKMKNDGTSKTMLCEGRRPDWSPVEDRIVAEREVSSRSVEIISFDSSGNNFIQLTSDGRGNGHPAYSPNGKQILYYSNYNYPYGEVMMMNTDGTGVRAIIDRACGYVSSWSPTGDRILYTRRDLKNYYQNGTVWIASINGRKIIQLTRGVSPE